MIGSTNHDWSLISKRWNRRQRIILIVTRREGGSLQERQRKGQGRKVTGKGQQLLCICNHLMAVQFSQLHLKRDEELQCLKKGILYDLEKCKYLPVTSCGCATASGVS